MPYNVDDPEDLDEDILSTFLNRPYLPSATQESEHQSNAVTKVDLESIGVVDLQSSEDEIEDVVNSVNTSNVADEPSLSSNTVRDDSFTSVQKDSTDDSISTSTLPHSALSPSGHPETQCQKLLPSTLPTKIRALLDQWYARKGLHQPPPCAIPYYNKTVFSTHTGKPVKYEHQNGEQLEVVLYTLPELLPRFKEKFVIVVQGPVTGPFVVRYLRPGNGRESGVPYFIWEGVGSNDPLGWESEPSIRKVVVPAVPMVPVMPLWGGRVTELETFGPDNHAVESDCDAEPDELGAYVKAEKDTQLNDIQDDWQKSPEPETSPTTMPNEIRTLLNRWYSHRGSKQPPPCAVDLVTTQSLKPSKAGSVCTFTHRTGMPLRISVCILPEFAASSVGRRYITLAEGQSHGPFVIGFIGNRGRTPPVPYHVWQGLDADDPDGWEAEASIYKDVEERKRSPRGLKDELLDPVHGDVVDDSDGESLIHVSKHGERVSTSPKLERNGVLTTRDLLHAAQPNHVAVGSLMPESIKKLINQWCDRPGHSLKSLPCSTTSPFKTLSCSSGGRPAMWEHVNGEELEVSMYPLCGTLITNTEYPKVIVAQGPSLKPCVISYYRRGDKAESVSYRIWNGIEGNTDGFEREASVKKIFFPRPEAASRPAPASGLLKGHLLPNLKKAGTDDRSANLEPTTRKRKRPDDELDTSLIISKRPFKQLRTQERESDFSTRPSASAIKKHMQNNAVLLFYSPSSEIPRMRLFNVCDTVQKLFAQAMAGDLFDDSGGAGSKGDSKGGKVLSFRFGGVRKVTDTARDILVVEDDEEDFEALVTAIEARDWWVAGKGGDLVEGSGTVEVRTKR